VRRCVRGRQPALRVARRSSLQLRAAHTMPDLGMGVQEGSTEAIEADLNAGVLCDVWFLDGAAAAGAPAGIFCEPRRVAVSAHNHHFACLLALQARSASRTRARPPTGTRWR
jgi:hypothetical protein